MSKIWYTSDTHFGSERTLELSKRPFKSVEEMDNTIISNWNKVVAPEDYVFHLGDFGDYERVKELNGKIVLVKGNYENKDTLTTLEDLKNYGFIRVHGNACHYFIKKGSEKYFISMGHEPSKVKSYNGINLFGHVHKLCMIKPYGLNVGTDCHNFYPIDFDTVLFYYNAIKNHYDNEVFF